MVDADHPRFASVLGLGFGDCGKGLFTDFLCRRWKAHTVVRFNGGAQAGHNVVLPDGTHHTFSQFGSGSFNPGVRTILTYPVLVHPTALLVENDHLQKAGVHDGLARLLIDSRCRIITPFHQAAGRLRELKRGTEAHGTCGVGIGETVNHSLLRPEEVIQYGDLRQAGMTRDKLEHIRRNFLNEFLDSNACQNPEAGPELKLLRDETITAAWVECTRDLLLAVPPAGADAIEERMHKPGTVIFEGAQGLLLDEWLGFHPFTTWSSTHGDAVDALAKSLSLPEQVMHFGVLRTYLTRHGPGPFPTFDPALDIIEEPHNDNKGWQGDFRRGHPDEVLLRYSLSNAGRLSGLLISHLDIFNRGHSLRWCSHYTTSEHGTVNRLVSSTMPNLNHQDRLTVLLRSASPVYASSPIDSAASFLGKIADSTDLPIAYGSYGTTYQSIHPGGIKH